VPPSPLKNAEESAQNRHARAMREELMVELDDALSAGGIRQRKRSHWRRSLAYFVAERTANGLRRLADLFGALLLMLFLSPIIVGALLLAGLRGGGVVRRERLGRWATRFYAYQFEFPEGSFSARSEFLTQMPSLVNVLKGDMSFVGPRPIAPDEEFAEKRIAWKRYNLRPGLLSLWWLRKRANIAYGTEANLDMEYVESQNFWGDLGIAARAIPAALVGSGSSVAPPHIQFLGVKIDNLTMAEASTQISEMSAEGAGAQVSFVNADCVNIACEDPAYLKVLGESKLVLADGIGVRLAGKILNQNVRENVNGTDMFPILCDTLDKNGRSLYLLGGKPGIAEDVGRWVKEHHPGLQVAGIQHGFFTPEELPSVKAAIRAAKPSVLLVALGCPRQEKWIAEHAAETDAGVLIGVGGLLDFYSGRIPRAPAWIRELGMEWFYRFWQEPGRMWRRYFVGNFTFLYRVLRERFRMRAAERAEVENR